MVTRFTSVWTLTLPKCAAVVYVRRGDTMHAVDEFVNLFDTPAMIEAIKERYPEH